MYYKLHRMYIIYLPASQPTNQPTHFRYIFGMGLLCGMGKSVFISMIYLMYWQQKQHNNNRSNSNTSGNKKTKEGARSGPTLIHYSGPLERGQFC